MALDIDKWGSMFVKYPWSHQYWFDKIERTMISEQELFERYKDRNPSAELFLSKDYIPVEGYTVVSVQKAFVKMNDCKEIEAKLNGLDGAEYYNTFMDYFDNTLMEGEYKRWLRDAEQLPITHWIDKNDIPYCTALLRFRTKKPRGPGNGYWGEIEEIIAAEERDEQEYKATLPRRID